MSGARRRARRRELDELERGGDAEVVARRRLAAGPVVRLAGGGARPSACARTTTSVSPTTRRSSRPPREGLDRYGAGTASVRFICGLFTPHVELERDLAGFLGTEAALTYVSCWNANQALLDTLCGASTGDRSPTSSTTPRSSTAIRLARPGGKAVYAHADVEALRARARARCPAGSRTPGRHRRRVQHGGRPRAAARDPRGLPRARRDADRRRLARARRRRRPRPRHAPSTSGARARST